jgi:1-acyl-sn-glycerol-3-phosphate acyltransferase
MNGGGKALIQKILHLLLFRPVIKLVFGIHINGLEHLQNLDRYIIIANHNSHLDVFLLFHLLAPRRISRTHPVAEEIYFSKSRIVFSLVKLLFDPIWIERGKPDTSGDPFAEIKKKLDSNHSVIIFPEGTRGKPGEMKHFKSGIGRLVEDYPDVPIIPVLLSGPERVLPKSSPLLLPFWNYVVIGPPQHFTGSHRDTTRNLESVLVDLKNSESARSHHRSLEDKQKPQTIAFLGIDGSGKSTVSRIVAEELSHGSRICRISDDLELFDGGEPQPVQPLGAETLRSFVSDYAKSAKSLKLYKIPKMAELLLRTQLYYDVRRWYSPAKIVMDGSPLLNMSAWAAIYRGELLDEDILVAAINDLTNGNKKIRLKKSLYSELPELLYLKRLKPGSMILPDVVFLVDVKPSTSIERIESRGGEKQVHENEEKLARLREGYLKVIRIIEKHWNTRVYKIDGEQSLAGVVADCISTLEKIEDEEGADEPAH